MMRLGLLLIAACTVEAAPAAPKPAMIECGTIDESAKPGLCAANRTKVFTCFVDALHAPKPARFTWRATGDDSHVTSEWSVELRKDGPVVVVHTVDSNGQPPITMTCPTTAMEKAANGCNVLSTKNCTCTPASGC